jgi:hypothetical protein
MFVIAKNIIHRDDCRKIKSVVSPISSDSDLTSDQYKKCKCCAKEIATYLEYQSICVKHDIFLKYCKEAAYEYNYLVNVLENEDIEITTNIEKWIISITDFLDDNTAKITLYHKNNLQFGSNTKCGKGLYPEYHVQFVKNMMPSEIINYVMKHEKTKWGANVTVTRDVKGAEIQCQQC